MIYKEKVLIFNTFFSIIITGTLKSPHKFSPGKGKLRGKGENYDKLYAKERNC